MLKVVPLGGLGEIGLNMMALEYDGYILVIDAGLMFPEEYMPGVDVVIPDFHFLRENRSKVQSMVLTHGHEDHIGAVPFFLKEFDVPVTATNFTIELLREKLMEHDLLNSRKLIKINFGKMIPFGPFNVEFIRVNHSTLDCAGLAIETPVGVIIHSGDFKIDRTPLDEPITDLNRFAYYGKKGVLALFSDSTNVEKEGNTLSENDVKKNLEEIFQSSRGRIIVAVFASNIPRIQKIIDLAITFERKVVFSGKSMKTNVRIAMDEGYILMPKDLEINEKGINRLPDEQVLIITTGTQGEPMSSLTRMSQRRHKQIKIRKGDTVILSSRFIPGNERAINSIINNLYRMGAEVVYEKVSDIHSSGHAYKEELSLMLDLVKPGYFIPIHGEYRHLVKHIQLAVERGIPPDKALLIENGDCLFMDSRKTEICEGVQVGRVLVDGKGVGDVGETVLRDRRKLSGDGVVIAFLAVDELTGKIIYGPDIISKGFIFEEEKGFILEDAKRVVLELMDEIENASHIDWNEVAPDIKRRLKRFFYSIIERSPLILPIIIPV